MEFHAEHSLISIPRELVEFPPLPRTMDLMDLVYSIELSIAAAVEIPYSYRQLTGPSLSIALTRPFVQSLIHPRSRSGSEGNSNASPKPPLLRTDTHQECRFEDQHRGIVAALMIARNDFSRETFQDDMATGYREKGIAQARAITAEIIATRFLYHVALDADRIDFLTYECKPSHGLESIRRFSEDSNSNIDDGISDLATTPLMKRSEDIRRVISRTCCIDIESYYGFNTLELAVMGGARKFLCTGPVESVLSRIWSGKIIFWDSIKTGATKSAKLYEYPSYDMYSRLRVPRYRTFFMMTNYAILLFLFYGLLFRQQQNLTGPASKAVSWIEILLHIWFAGFVVDEAMQVREAGSIGHYVMDYWSFFDLAIIFLYLFFFCLRIVGYLKDDYSITAMAFDVLSLEALLLVPRFFSFLSIFPYFGTLLPCLKELTKDFVKFLSLISIIYLGFFTTFSFLGRDTFTIKEMSWLLIKVFFGASLNGFDAAPKISESFGPTLMLIFVTLTNILLVTVLVSILSQKFSVMMLNAREEYITLFAGTVVECMTTADRLTYFYPPLNLIGLIMRPLRLKLDHDQYQSLRILVLKLTHWPFVLVVWVFEALQVLYNKHRLRLMHQPWRESSRYDLSIRSSLDAGAPGFYEDEDMEAFHAGNGPNGGTPGIAGFTGAGFTSLT